MGHERDENGVNSHGKLKKMSRRRLLMHLLHLFRKLVFELLQSFYTALSSDLVQILFHNDCDSFMIPSTFLFILL